MADGMNDLVEKVARELYFKSIERDGGDKGDPKDERWKTAKARFAEQPSLYTRPANAFEDANIALRIVLDAIAEPSEIMVEEGAVASGMIQYTHEYKRPVTLQDEATTVYRAMIAALRKEIME